MRAGVDLKLDMDLRTLLFTQKERKEGGREGGKGGKEGGRKRILGQGRKMIWLQRNLTVKRD